MATESDKLLQMSMQSIKIHPEHRLWDSGGGSEWYKLEKRGRCSPRVLKRSLVAYIGLELVIYLVLYYIIHVVYRAALNEEQKKNFEDVVNYFDDKLSPMSKDLTFLLGFYVSLVAKRWWDQYKNLPWPDDLGLLLNGLVVTDNSQSATMRENLMRYSLLSYVLCIRRISNLVLKKFPDSESLIKAGLANEAEMSELRVNSAGNVDNQWWLPLSWSMNLVKQAKLDKVVPSDHKELLRGITRFRQDLEQIESYQHIPIPPVYKQVVLLAIYCYFGLALIAGQETDRPLDDEGTKPVIIYFPIFLVLRFIFFVGWLKVAEAISNPFGDDEDDFQIEHLLSRHIWASGRILSQFQGAPVTPVAPTTFLNTKTVILTNSHNDDDDDKAQIVNLRG